MKLTKGKRKQLVNAAMDNDRVSLTKNAKKNWELTRFMFGECLNENPGLKYCKRKFTKAEF